MHFDKFIPIRFNDNSYDLPGSSTSICGIDGRWSAEAPLCTGICNQAKPPDNNITDVVVLANSLDCPYSDVPYSGLILTGKICHYSCDPPYFSNFPNFRVCLDSGQFNHPYPTCKIPETSEPYL